MPSFPALKAHSSLALHKVPCEAGHMIHIEALVHQVCGPSHINYWS